MEKDRKERWGILVDGILLPGFDSKEEAEKYIGKHPELRSPLPVRLHLKKSKKPESKLTNEEFSEMLNLDDGFWWD